MAKIGPQIEVLETKVTEGFVASLLDIVWVVRVVPELQRLQ